MVLGKKNYDNNNISNNKGDFNNSKLLFSELEHNSKSHLNFKNQKTYAAYTASKAFIGRPRNLFSPSTEQTYSYNAYNNNYNLNNKKNYSNHDNKKNYDEKNYYKKTYDVASSKSHNYC